MAGVKASVETGTGWETRVGARVGVGKTGRVGDGAGEADRAQAARRVTSTRTR